MMVVTCYLTDTLNLLISCRRVELVFLTKKMLTKKRPSKLLLLACAKRYINLKHLTYQAIKNLSSRLPLTLTFLTWNVHSID